MEKENANRLVYDLTFTQDALKEIPYDLRTINYMKFLEVFVKRWDRVQISAVSLAYARLLSNATGEMLDYIASWFFIERDNMTDDELKASLQLYALRLSSTTNRDDIYTLMKILAGGGFVNIYKNYSGRIEVCLGSDCLDISNISVDIEDIFPVNTNLQITTAPLFGTPFGVTSVYATEPSTQIGALGSAFDEYTRNNTVPTILIDNEVG